uniref:Ig-like domain-containing protein n=1 Tax=Branchiostoma floridae TaxID=7739 RepID=C3YV78_BRAFL|eukprot:XP_002599782.1 hypothetical protein BRAFLDRAFT_70251 [Branchiostoma floridae]
MGTHPMDKKAETWRRKMAGGWLLVVLGLCLAIAPSCAGESGGYSLQLGLTLTQGYFPNNTYIVNITRDGGRVEEYKGYRHGAVFSRVSVKAIDGENMPVGTFVELLYSSMRTCTEMSRTGGHNIPIQKGPLPTDIIYCRATPPTDHAYFVVVPVNQSVALGEPATFHCEALAEASTHISITWAFHNGRDIPLPYHSRHRLDPDTRDLTILAVEEGDLGKYTCQVSTDNWNTKYLQHAWLSKYVKPRITTNMEDQEVRKGERMTLACQATGTPPPAYTWLYRNEDVRQLGSRYTVRDGTLEVQPIQVEDFGRYTCRAENLLGRDDAGTDLDVLYPPEIEDQNYPTPKKVLKGTKDVHLTCYARGNPTPEYAWFAPNTSETVRDKWDLFIREVQPKDAGVYRCEAFNNEGMDQTIVELVVQVHVVVGQTYPPKLVVVGPGPAGVMRGRGRARYVTSGAGAACWGPVGVMRGRGKESDQFNTSGGAVCVDLKLDRVDCVGVS